MSEVRQDGNELRIRHESAQKDIITTVATRTLDSGDIELIVSIARAGRKKDVYGWVHLSRAQAADLAKKLAQ